MVLLVNWNELTVKFAPFVWQFLREVLIDSEICANEPAISALISVGAFLAEHDTVVRFHLLGASSAGYGKTLESCREEVGGGGGVGGVGGSDDFGLIHGRLNSSWKAPTLVRITCLNVAPFAFAVRTGVI